jgi:LPPG:FO 2-phospho-L-lactate transferase
MAELGLPVSAAAVAEHYGNILDGYVVDEADADEVDGIGVPVSLAPTLMVTLEDREVLARAILRAAARGL